MQREQFVLKLIAKLKIFCVVARCLISLGRNSKFLEEGEVVPVETRPDLLSLAVPEFVR